MLLEARLLGYGVPKIANIGSGFFKL